MFTMQSFSPGRMSAGVFSNWKKILVEDGLVVPVNIWRQRETNRLLLS